MKNFIPPDRRMDVSEFLNPEGEYDVFEEISFSTIVNNIFMSVQGPVEGEMKEELLDSDSVLPFLSVQMKPIALAKVIAETLSPGKFGVIRLFRQVQERP